MFLTDVIPVKWQKAIIKIFAGLNELRLRAEEPISVQYNGKRGFLAESGFATVGENAYIAHAKDISDVLFLACEKSVYSYSDNMVNGFLTLSDGCRIGVCGRIVKDRGEIVAIRDFSSLNIRVPHAVAGCSNRVFGEVYPNLSSMLVIAPPGAGKTTFLRDIICQFKGKKVNILVSDERNEIACVRGGKCFFDLGEHVDVFANADKRYVFECGIRTMNPDIVVCDELFENDLSCLEICVAAGVKIFASVHAENIHGAKNRLGKKIMELFDKFVVLGKKNHLGEIVAVYEKEILK